jgi:hypothetical protein
MDREITDALTAADIARLTGVDDTTARRWKRGKPMPEPARRLLQILTTGELGTVCRVWRGWWLDAKHGVLVSPEQWTFEPGHILAIPFLHGMVASYQSQLRDTEAQFRLATQADWVEQRYVVPGSDLAQIEPPRDGNREK